MYFPINFKPPKDDQFKITPQQLKQSLNACFLATDHRQFLENVMPFIIEKMNTSESGTRSECLALLKAMVLKFDHNGPLKSHLEMIVSSLLNDYFNMIDAAAQTQIKECLCQILDCFEHKLSTDKN
jgi:hypothetical protein